MFMLRAKLKSKSSIKSTTTPTLESKSNLNSKIDYHVDPNSQVKINFQVNPDTQVKTDSQVGPNLNSNPTLKSMANRNSTAT